MVEAAPLAACPHCGQLHAAHVLRCPDTDIILPLAGRMLDGRFRFIELIGRGGMASVWLARNERVDRLVAIKLIRPEVARDDDMVARFRAEARAAGRIGHPNICDILDSGRSPIGPYIVMEYLRGRSLGELLADCGQLAPPVAVMLVREALRGLGAAHKAGIVHRDLKPENLFLHRPETGDPTVKIMDFGVAKFIDGTNEVRTQHGALLGTPEYMAPEQFRGAAHAEPRTDLWAVGAILYRAITGRNAFGGPTVAATLLMVSSEDATPMDALVPDVPPALVRIVARCLEKQPAARFADVQELDAALLPFAARERDMAPWEPAATEREDSDERVPSEGSRPTSPWSAREVAVAPAAEPTDIERPRPRPKARSSRWWIATLALFVGAGAFAWLRNAAIETLEREGDTADARAGADDERDAIDDPRNPAAAASTGEPEAPPVEPPIEPPPRVELVPAAPDPEPAEPGATTGPAIEPAPTDDAGDGSITPTVPPPPPDGGVDGTTLPIGPTPVDPVGVVRVGKLVVLEATLAAAPHRRAKSYCDRLRAVQYLGVRGWTLPNPAQSEKLAGNAAVKKGKYWTSALYRGRALVVSLPSGAKTSVSAERGRARGLCIARWP